MQLSQGLGDAGMLWGASACPCRPTGSPDGAALGHRPGAERPTPSWPTSPGATRLPALGCPPATPRGPQRLAGARRACPLLLSSIRTSHLLRSAHANIAPPCFSDCFFVSFDADTFQGPHSSCVGASQDLPPGPSCPSRPLLPVLLQPADCRAPAHRTSGTNLPLHARGLSQLPHPAALGYRCRSNSQSALHETLTPLSPELSTSAPLPRGEGVRCAEEQALVCPQCPHSTPVTGVRVARAWGRGEDY